MEIVDNQVRVHVTEVGGCVRKAIWRAQGKEVTNRYYDAEVGTAVHKVCETYLKALQDGNDRMTIPEAMDKAKDDGDTAFWDQARVDIEGKVRKLVEWLEQENRDGNLQHGIQTEVKVDKLTDLNIKGMPVTLVGTADIIYPLEVIDIKSGKSRSKKHAWQVSAYSMMILGAEDHVLRTGRVVYLGAPFGEKVYKNGKVHRYHERVVTREDVLEYYTEFSAKLVEYVKKIDEAYPLDPDAEDCGDCFFCPFKNHCYGTEYSGARQTEEGY